VRQSVTTNDVSLLWKQRRVKETVGSVCAEFTLSSAVKKELDKAVNTAAVYISVIYRIVWYVMSVIVYRAESNFCKKRVLSGQSLLKKALIVVDYHTAR
jgi:hypothetical protein